MRKSLIAAAGLMIALSACNSETEKTKVASASDADSITYAYKPTYSSSFEMGDPKKSQIILKLWKDYDEGNLLASKDAFADSIELYFKDGFVAHGHKDSVLAKGQFYREQLASAQSTVHAFFPVKSTDKNEDWVCVWGTEIDIDKKGKADTIELQETWRFNKDGKINLLYQFGATPSH